MIQGLSILPAAIRANDESITVALLRVEQTDSALAAAIWECSQRRYWRVHGFKSLEDYMRDRWKSQGVLGMKGRTLQRLLRDYRVAQEVPLFKREFDNLSRSNRRLIAQVITRENAAEWIEAAKTLDARTLERRIKALPGAAVPQRPTRLYMGMTEGVRDVWERAKAACRKQELEDGRDPQKLSDAACLEMVCAEFIATYGG